MRPMMRATRATLAALLGSLLLSSGGCKKPQEKAEPTGGALTLTEVEIKRGQDACAAYQAQVCAAAQKKPDRKDLADACQLAPSLGDAMRTALEIARHPESIRRDVLQAQDAVRKSMDHCLSGVAKLAAE